MLKHPLHITGYYCSIDDLVKSLSDMSRDKIVTFTRMLGDDFRMQGDNDHDHGRVKLANELYEVADTLYMIGELEGGSPDTGKKIYVSGFYGQAGELVAAIGNMRYDKTALFVRKLADSFVQKDKCIAHMLYLTADKIYMAYEMKPKKKEEIQ